MSSYVELRVVDLRAICAERGLTKGGIKSKLIARLMEDDAKTPGAAVAAPEVGLFATKVAKSAQGNLEPSLAKNCWDDFFGDTDKSHPEGKTQYQAFVGAEWGEGRPTPHADVRYCCYAPEIAPKTGRLHCQFYVYFHRKKTVGGAMKWLKKFWKFTSPVKPAIDTASTNRVYCGFGRYVHRKSGKVKEVNPAAEEFGDMPAQGDRIDIQKTGEKILSGELTCKDIRRCHAVNFHMYGRTYEKLEMDRMRDNERTERTKGLWLWGSTGVGKTETAFAIAGADRFVVCKSEAKRGWWDGYRQQAVLVINEFRGWIEYDDMLDLVDKYASYKVGIRGQEPIPFNSRLVIVTSSLAPEECYRRRAAQDSLDQLTGVRHNGGEPRFKVINMTEYMSDERIKELRAELLQ